VNHGLDTHIASSANEASYGQTFFALLFQVRLDSTRILNPAARIEHETVETCAVSHLGISRYIYEQLITKFFLSEPFSRHLDFDDGPLRG